MVRTPSSDKNGLKKGTWTPEEDRILIEYVTRYGHWNWRLLPKFAGLARCGKSCRLRWMNYLRPNIKRGNYTQDEDETIIKLLQRLGNRWSAIAAQMPGRTDNEIKNYWHSKLKKRFQKNSVIHVKGQVSKSKDQSPLESVPNHIIGPLQSVTATSQSADSCPSSTLSSSSDLSITTDHSAAARAKDEFAFLDGYKEPMSESYWLEPYVDDISYVPSEIFGAETEGFSPMCDVELWTYDNDSMNTVREAA